MGPRVPGFSSSRAASPAGLRLDAGLLAGSRGLKLWPAARSRTGPLMPPGREGVWDVLSRADSFQFVDQNGGARGAAAVAVGAGAPGGWAGACAAERPVEAGGAEVFAGGSSGDAAAGAFDEGAVGQGLAHRARGCGSGWLWWRGVPRGWPSRWAAARAGGGYAWAVRRRAAMIAPTVVRTRCGSDRAAMRCCSCSRLQPRDRSADGNRPAGADTCAARQRHQAGGEQDPGADAAEKGSARNPVSHARSLQQLLAWPPPRLVAPRLFGDLQPRQYVARRRQTGRAGSAGSGTG
ncbi:hypothetical protein BJ996_007208 [Streptomyces phaeogriseichromatogenes]|nr:hypothetical protein [Streptomyces murinus]